MSKPVCETFRVAMSWSGWARERCWPSERISPLPVRTLPWSPKVFRFSQGPAVDNVTLPKDLIESMNQISGPRSRSRLIAESLRKHIWQIKKDELDRQLEEGYRATAKEGRALSREFETADLEGWDDY